jgi:MFS transporter, DHA1 family, chloramphenicol/florfenicol resistance protein
MPPKTWTYSLRLSLLILAPFDLLASLAMDAYLPVVPQMPAALHTTPATIQLTLSF